MKQTFTLNRKTNKPTLATSSKYSVKLPVGEDLHEWLAINSRVLFSFISELILFNIQLLTFTVRFVQFGNWSMMESKTCLNYQLDMAFHQGSNIYGLMGKALKSQLNAMGNNMLGMFWIGRKISSMILIFSITFHPNREKGSFVNLFNLSWLLSFNI